MAHEDIRGLPVLVKNNKFWEDITMDKFAIQSSMVILGGKEHKMDVEGLGIASIEMEASMDLRTVVSDIVEILSQLPSNILFLRLTRGATKTSFTRNMDFEGVSAYLAECYAA